MDLSLSGRVLEADEANRVGLLSRLVEEPRAVAASLLDVDPRVLRTITRRLRDTAPLEEQTTREAAAFADLVENRT